MQNDITLNFHLVFSLFAQSVQLPHHKALARTSGANLSRNPMNSHWKPSQPWTPVACIDPALQGNIRAAPVEVPEFRNRKNQMGWKDFEGQIPLKCIGSVCFSQPAMLNSTVSGTSLQSSWKATKNPPPAPPQKDSRPKEYETPKCRRLDS